jgi:hypothetical protein
MLITTHVIYRGKVKRVEELSPTCGYKVDVQCPECGEIRNIYYSSLCRAGHTMCHACSIKKKMGKTLEIGSKHNRLTVIKASAKSGYSICECECGTIKEVANYAITSGGTKSCGCLLTEHIKKVGCHREKEGHWNWQGGISTDRQIDMGKKNYKEWRTSVFERDEYTCQKCNRVGRRLRAHHILNYANNQDKCFDVNNGITLCEKCHRSFHHINGFNTNREQLEEFLKGR